MITYALKSVWNPNFVYTEIVPSIHRLELESYVQKVFDKYSRRVDSTSLGNDPTPLVEQYNKPQKLIF